MVSDVEPTQSSSFYVHRLFLARLSWLEADMNYMGE